MAPSLFPVVSKEQYFANVAREAEKSAVQACQDRESSNKSEESRKREEVARGKRPVGRPRKQFDVGDVLVDDSPTQPFVRSGPGECSNSRSINKETTGPSGLGESSNSKSINRASTGPGGPSDSSVRSDRSSSIEFNRPGARGRLVKHGRRPPSYTNWFTEGLWAPIEQALKACRYSPAATVTYLNHEFPSTRRNPGRYAKLAATTIRGWLNPERRGLSRKVLGILLHMGLNDAPPISLASFARRQQGTIFQSVPDLEEDFKKKIQTLRDGGHIINSVTVSIICRALMQAKAPHLLAENGGGFRASRSWVRLYLATTMGWTFRDSTTNSSTLPSDWQGLGRSMAGRLAVAVKVHNIPPELVVNMDQTGLSLVPVGGERTYAMRGCKEVGVARKDDKRSVTVVPAVSAAGALLPFQVIFTGKSKNVLPMCTEVVIATREGWHFTFTNNHWSNLKTVMEWFDHIVKPYYRRACEGKGLIPGRQKMVVILDCWSVHRSQELRDWIQLHHPYIVLIYVPARTTSKLQPCDVILQRPLKAGFTSLWASWAVTQASARFSEGLSVTFSALDLAISTLRCKAVEFLLDTWHSLNTRTGLLWRGWEITGLTRAWDPAFQAVPAWFLETVITAVAIFDRLTINCEDEEPLPDRSMGTGGWPGDSNALAILENVAGANRMVPDMNEDDPADEEVEEGAWEDAYQAYLMDPLANPDFPL